MFEIYTYHGDVVYYYNVFFVIVKNLTYTIVTLITGIIVHT